MIKFDELLVNFFETLKKGFLTWIAWMKKVEELKDLGCSVRGRFYDLAWSKPVLRAPAVHGVSSYVAKFRLVCREHFLLNNYFFAVTYVYCLL